jgi:hypothetical protein
MDFESDQQDYSRRMQEYEKQNFDQKPLSQIEYFIDQIFQFDTDRFINQYKSGGLKSSSETSEASFHLTQKLSFDSIKDKLNSQPDIFHHEAKHYKENRAIF